MQQWEKEFGSSSTFDALRSANASIHGRPAESSSSQAQSADAVRRKEEEDLKRAIAASLKVIVSGE
jgi:hypothetical protein